MQLTPLARPVTWARLFNAASVPRLISLTNAASGAADTDVGRSLNPSVFRACTWRAARAAAWAGPRRRSVGRSCAGCVGRAPSVAWGAAGRTRYACQYRRAHARMGGGRPPAAPLPWSPPNHARSRRRWRGPEAGGFLRRRLVLLLASVSNVASGAAEAGVGPPTARNAVYKHRHCVLPSVIYFGAIGVISLCRYVAIQER